jgi:hypothetical protein
LLLLLGSYDGKIHFWDISPPPGDPSNWNRPAQGPQATLQPVKTLEGHSGPSRIVGFNPRYAMFVSGGNELAFWLPEVGGAGGSTGGGGGGGNVSKDAGAATPAAVQTTTTTTTVINS